MEESEKPQIAAGVLLDEQRSAVTMWLADVSSLRRMLVPKHIINQKEREYTK